MRLTALLLLVSSALAAANYIQVPAIVGDKTMELRLNELHRINSVFDHFGELKRVVKKEVYEIVNGKETAFPICYEDVPYVSLQGSSTLYVGEGPNTFGLLYDFEKIKNRRNLIDIEKTDTSIFYAREDGYLRMVDINESNLRLTYAKEFKTNESKIGSGNIVLLPNATYLNTVGYGVFINSNQAVLFDLAGRNFTQLEGYLPMKDFQAAVALENVYFAVAYGQQGVVMYSVDLEAKKLKVESTYQKSNLDLKIAQYVDLAYDHSRKLLFMLDRYSGMSALQLIMAAGRFQAQLTSSVIKSSDCSLIHYDGFTQALYLNCKELAKYHIKNWPIVDEKVLPKQEISIRSITSAYGTVVLAGRNVMEVISEERKVAVYQNKYLERLFINGSVFLSASEHYLIIGKYHIIPPEIYCLGSEKSLIGKHLMLFKITAECNLDYFKAVGFQPGQIFHQDKCVYSIYQTVSFWEPKEVNVSPFLITFVTICAMGLALLMWWIFSQIKLSKLRKQVEDYQNLEEEQVNKPGVPSEPMIADVSPAVTDQALKRTTDGLKLGSDTANQGVNDL